MSAVESLQSNEKAIAMRLVRSQTVPHDFWLWLGGINATPLDAVANWVDAGVLQSIAEIVAPNLAAMDAGEQSQYRDTDTWIAAILAFGSRRAGELELNFGDTLLAVGLLPIYRGLATRDFPDALKQTRHRLAEMLVLIGIAHELGDDFVQLMQQRGAPATSPYVILQASLKINLCRAAVFSREIARVFDPGLNQFDRPIAAESHAAQPSSAKPTLAWSDPQVLWQIASQLAAKKPKIELPISWADVSLPWPSICGHWNSLAQRMTLPAGEGEAGAEESPEYGPDDHLVSEMIDDVLAMQADISEVGIKEVPDAAEGRIESAAEQEEANENRPISGRAHASHALGGPRLEPAETDAEMDAEEEFHELGAEDGERSVPDIALIEIVSHADALFAARLQQQISTARSENRTVCLVALSVESDEGSGAGEPLGWTGWQQKLANWLADHPHVHEPAAFVTTDGQLVVSMLDVERTLATNLVREGLALALVGQSVDEHGARSQAAIPCRYYGGIGSVTAPNANFASEQLVAATWRCLSAAQSQGKATIKSIEVY